MENKYELLSRIKVEAWEAAKDMPGYGTKKIFTLEELYQSFKTRMAEEASKEQEQ